MYQLKESKNVALVLETFDTLFNKRDYAAAGLLRGGGTVQAHGGLTPWQIRRLAAHIEANLDTPLGMCDLSAPVRLSPSHFLRAFKDGLGYPPHGRVMRRRMERAQGLMLSTDAPRVQIAVDCGLADLSHFSRLFRRFAGESPDAWRRAHATLPTDGRGLSPRSEP